MSVAVPVLVAVLLGASPACAVAGPATLSVGAPFPEPTEVVAQASDPSLEALYDRARAFGDFLADASRRKDLWERRYRDGDVEPSALERARRLEGTWRLLAIAEDWCSDSVNTIPYLALLADRSPALELRVIDSEAGQALMEAHLTPDGRPATPTVLVLDSAYEEVGCWIERPSKLQAWALENREALGRRFMPEKMAWYREDAGRSTVDEVLAVVEAAAEGRTVCERGGRAPSERS